MIFKNMYFVKRHMKDLSKVAMEAVLKQQRQYFASDQTKNTAFRIEKLRQFKSGILRYQDKISEALWKDLHKSFEEAYLTEISIVLQEIDYHIKHLKCWAKTKRIHTPLHLLPSSSSIAYEPLGVALIMAPWNYPFQLLMNSLVGAISSGCCAMLKPSPYAQNTAEVMEDLIHEVFDRQYIEIVQGGRDVNQILLELRFDFIFFTGSPAVGKVVMKAAAEHLTPLILELGGKSPCIVDAGANIDIAAKRIAWGKAINAGQTCIAPDYLFVHRSVKSELLQKIATNLENMYGVDFKRSRFYPRIVNEQAMNRLQKLLGHGKIAYGGEVDIEEKYISPTIIDEVSPDFPIMQEEIFGPILPVLTFEEIGEAISYINANEKPLAFYYFGKSARSKDILQRTTSGGACINDTLMHITNHHLPFGGVGNSGLGKYHGHNSFLAFSNARAVVNTPTWVDLPFKYVPFKYFNLIRKIL
jgi:aldehyde dehydrogenase (NAD+)